MKALAIFGTLLVVLHSLLASDAPVITRQEADQREHLFQRFLAVMRGTGELTHFGLSMTNFDNPFFRQFLNVMTVHPSFGLRWDEVPAPTIVGTNAMQAVESFIATNGWNMETGGLLLTYGLDKPRAIRGLPWEVIREREFPALTAC
jgi:hypothetical protein